MQNISSTEELKKAINLLEEEHFIKEQDFRRQLFITYTSLRPVNILKSTLMEISSPSILEEVSGTGMGLIGGFLSRKIFVGTSGNAIRKLLGSVLQLGVTALVTQNSGIIQSAGMSLIQRLINSRQKSTVRMTPSKGE
jgi:hypothetical protein